jgi:hypothetical protein
MQIEHHVNSRPIVNAIHEFGVAHRNVIMHEATISMMRPGNQGILTGGGGLVRLTSSLKKLLHVKRVKMFATYIEADLNKFI